MTQKELLYVEDAIGHENNTVDICNFIICSLDNEDLIDFMKKQLKKHESIKEKLISLLEESINE